MGTQRGEESRGRRETGGMGGPLLESKQSSGVRTLPLSRSRCCGVGTSSSIKISPLRSITVICAFRYR
jgi:hypothetical protein